MIQVQMGNLFSILFYSCVIPALSRICSGRSETSPIIIITLKGKFLLGFQNKELNKLSRGEICVANFKAPPANGVSMDRF